MPRHSSAPPPFACFPLLFLPLLPLLLATCLHHATPPAITRPVPPVLFANYATDVSCLRHADSPLCHGRPPNRPARSIATVWDSEGRNMCRMADVTTIQQPTDPTTPAAATQRNGLLQRAVTMIVLRLNQLVITRDAPGKTDTNAYDDANARDLLSGEKTAKQFQGSGDWEVTAKHTEHYSILPTKRSQRTVFIVAFGLGIMLLVVAVREAFNGHEDDDFGRDDAAYYGSGSEQSRHGSRRKQILKSVQNWM